MSNSVRKPHVIVFPIPLQGHINPMMLLAQHLNSSGIRVTFLLPERILLTLNHNNNAFSAHPRHPCQVNDHCDTACYGDGDMLSNIKYGNKLKNGAIKVHDNSIHGHENGGNDDDGHCGEAKPISIATHVIDACHTNVLGNDKNDDDDDDDGDEDDNDGDVNACNNDYDFVPPIQFESLPDSSSFSDDQTLPMSSYTLAFLDSMPLLMRKLEELLERMQQMGEPATCIISDSFVPWTQDVANKFGIPRMEFWSSSVTVYAMGYHIPQLIDKGYLPMHPGDGQESCVDIIPGLPPFRLVDFFCDLQPHAISSPVFHLICKAFSRAKEAYRVLVNSFFDLEKDIIEALQAEGVSICPIGPLLPSQLCMNPTKPRHSRSIKQREVMSTSLYAADADCLAWLDAQAASSVIYVSFGSMVCISKEEIEELMLGLEGSEHPYLLVIRPDMVPGVCAQTTCARGRGRICAWVPQIHVLRHPAVGGFLTHCGWNSIMEGMYMGVPMIACPRESEQHTNMKCLRNEWKVAIGLDKQQRQQGENRQMQQGVPTNRVQIIKKEFLEGAIKALMQEEEGESVRERMKGLQKAAKRAAHKPGSCLQILIEDIMHNMIEDI